MFKEISGDQYRTFLVWVEKYSNGQKDVFATIKAHLNDWLNIAVDDSVISTILDSQHSLDAFKYFLENNQVVVRFDDDKLYGFYCNVNNPHEVFCLEDLDFILKAYSDSSYSKDTSSLLSSDAQVTDTNVLPAPISEMSADISTTTAITPTTENTVATPDSSLDLLTLEIKFHLNQMGFHVIEVGKRLIQAKEMLPHGEWTNWLKNNFALSQDTASNFMNVAKRFGSNSETSRNFNFSQLVTLLKLPAGDEQKFIEQKAAEGNPVEDMTIKKLCDEIAQWKDRAKKDNDEISILKATVDRQNSEIIFRGDTIKNLHGMRDNLVRQLADANKQLQEKSVPEDYDALKKELQLLREKPVEVAVEKPADYDAIKKELQTLRDEQSNFKHTYEGVRNLKLIFNSANFLCNSTSFFESVKFLADKNPDAFYQNFSILRGFMAELENYLAMVQDEKKASNDAQ